MAVLIISEEMKAEFEPLTKLMLVNFWQRFHFWFPGSSYIYNTLNPCRFLHFDRVVGCRGVYGDPESLEKSESSVGITAI